VALKVQGIDVTDMFDLVPVSNLARKHLIHNESQVVNSARSVRRAAKSKLIANLVQNLFFVVFAQPVQSSFMSNQSEAASVSCKPIGA
jgi:hypothetical protein